MDEETRKLEQKVSAYFHADYFRGPNQLRSCFDMSPPIFFIGTYKNVGGGLSIKASCIEIIAELPYFDNTGNLVARIRSADDNSYQAFQISQGYTSVKKIERDFETANEKISQGYYGGSFSRKFEVKFKIIKPGK